MNTTLSLFKEQIQEDIDIIKNQWGYVDDNLDKDPYAFNYWVLSRIYSLDEEIIPDCITEYNDKAIDCFVHYKESKELFIVQNKYYGEDTKVSRKDVADFLETPLSKLRENNYKKSQELQNIFNSAKDDSEYKIYFHFYASNDNKSSDIDDLIKQFNNTTSGTEACFISTEYFGLPEIYEQYFGKSYHEDIPFDYALGTINKGTFASLREEYGIEQTYEAYYIVTPVCEIYKMIQEAEKKEYPIFEKNIREYLGKSGKVNAGIVKTLQSEKERKNFIYYNNGVTVVCEDIGASYTSAGGFRRIPLHNPQIVNGCQTVSSIKEVLQNYVGNIDKDFKDVYIMTKALVINDTSNPANKEFSEKVVKYTNSQNAISEKAFTSNIDLFYSLQEEFKRRGLLLLVKPSDANKFRSMAKKEKADLKVLAGKTLENLGYNVSSFTDTFISLEKLLQVFIAFMETGHMAFVKKNLVLDPSKELFEKYSLNIHNYITVDNMIRLYYMYKRAEYDKNNKKYSEDKRMPIPYYVIGFLGTLIDAKTNDNVNDLLNIVFSSKESCEASYEYLAMICKQYRKNYERTHKSDGGDYNNMIKRAIDEECLQYSIETVDDMYDLTYIKPWKKQFVFSS